MRFALVGATVALMAYGGLTDVTYLSSGGYGADLPEHRRIDVRSEPECRAVVERANLTLGGRHEIVCQRVPLYRHWANLARDAYDRGLVSNLAFNLWGGEAVAGTTPKTVAR